MIKPNVMIDFDKTISPVHGFYASPDVETVDAIKALSIKYNIIIYSCRGNREICLESDYVQLMEYLARYDIPYNSISSSKPLYAALIDDRAYNPEHIGWKRILDELL